MTIVEIINKIKAVHAMLLETYSNYEEIEAQILKIEDESEKLEKLNLILGKYNTLNELMARVEELARCISDAIEQKSSEPLNKLNGDDLILLSLEEIKEKYSL